MSMASKALETEETKTNEGRTVAGIVNSIETLEGGGFLVRRTGRRRSENRESARRENSAQSVAHRWCAVE